MHALHTWNATSMHGLLQDVIKFAVCSRSRRDVHVLSLDVLTSLFHLKFFLVLEEEVSKCFPRTTVGFLFAATVIPSLRTPRVFPCNPW